MRKRLPKTIKIGAITYRVIKHRKASKDLGNCDYNKRVIDLWKQEPCELPNSLIHECLHACLEDIIKSIMNDKKTVDDFEEDLVRLITPRFMGLLKDNPELLEYLTQE
jgi:hypothetical protein